MSRPVVAVIGAGAMGSQHARIVAGSDDATLGVVVDADADRAGALATRYGCKAANHFAAALLCDAAIVATSTDSHLAVASELMRSGVPVLIEKPLAASYSDAMTLVALSRELNLPITCGFVERHNPAIRTALEQLDGPARHVMAVRHSPPAGRQMSTVVWDLLIHDLDLALRICGIERLQILAATPPSEALDEVDCLARTESGTTVSLSASRLSQRKVRTWSIRCDELAIDVDLVRQNVTTYRHRAHAVGPGLAYRSETVIDIPYVRHGGEPLELQFRHFLRLLRGDLDVEAERQSLLPAHLVASMVGEVAGVDSLRA